MARTVTGFFDFQVNKMAMERMVLMNLAPDFFGIKNHCITAHLVQFSEPSGLKLPWKKKKKKTITKLCRTKRNQIIGVFRAKTSKIYSL